MSDSSYFNQFIKNGIDSDRANAMAEILDREALDPNAIDRRSDTDKELVSGVVDDINRQSTLGETLTDKEFDEYLSDGLDNVTFGKRVKQQDIDRFEKERLGEFDEPKGRRNGRVPKK